MKHLEHTFKTYVYNHYSISNTPIYFYNINIQHLQQTCEISETLETYFYNMWFSSFFYAMRPTPGLGPASDDPLS
jgi:hypothetical protein